MEEILAALQSMGIQMSTPECYDLSHVFEELIAIRPVEFDPDWYHTVMGKQHPIRIAGCHNLQGAV